MYILSRITQQDMFFLISLSMNPMQVRVVLCMNMMCASLAINEMFGLSLNNLSKCSNIVSENVLCLGVLVKLSLNFSSERLLPQARYHHQDSQQISA